MDEAGQVIELLWGEPSRPSRGPKPSLSIAAIADATVQIADTDGLDAVSMQRVAEVFGVTKMALYRYVSGKAQLKSRGSTAPSRCSPKPVSPGASRWMRSCCCAPTCATR